MKRWTAALLSVLLMLALFGCGNDSFLVSQALSPSELPDIVLPDQIENNGTQHLLEGSSLLLEEPRYSEEIGPEDLAKVFGQETLAWAGWSPDEVWGRYYSASFGQNGEAHLAGAFLTKAHPNTDDDVRVDLVVVEKEMISEEFFRKPGQVTELGNCPVTAVWSRSQGGEQLFCTAWALPDPSRNLLAAFIGDCRWEDPRQKDELLLALNSFMKACVCQGDRLDLHVLDRAPYPEPTPDPYRVLQVVTPEEATVDADGRLSFDLPVFDTAARWAVPDPIRKSDPVEIDGRQYRCEKTLTLSFPEQIWSDKEGSRRLLLMDTRVYGFLEDGEQREIRQLEQTLHWLGMEGDQLRALDSETDEDQAALAWTGYDQTNVRDYLLELKHCREYDKGKALERLARSFAVQAGLEEYLPKTEVPEGALTLVEGITMGSDGWLHFEDPQREKDYRLLAPVMDRSRQGETSSNEPVFQEWSPWRREEGLLSSQEGTLSVMVPVLLWQDDPDRPTTKVYVCYQKEWTVEDREGEKSFVNTGMRQCGAVLTLSPETGQWVPRVDLNSDGTAFADLTHEVRSAARQEQAAKADEVLEMIRLLKNNFAWLTGRGDYLH